MSKHELGNIFTFHVKQKVESIKRSMNVISIHFIFMPYWQQGPLTYERFN